MANNDVIIRISAQDAASPVFKRITNEAKAMGAQVDQVGTKSGGAFDKLSKGGAALGATFGVLSGALSDAARAAAEAEAATARLDTAFENAGLSTADYAAQITQLQDMSISLAFDDEDATDALARLVTTTGDVNRAMEDVGIAMDIARARQISLAEATKIVEAVEQGRTGALTRMGIAVDETMSKEEQLAAIQGKYAGQAEAYANTAAGAIDRYRVKWEEVQESVGGALGPLTSVIGLLPGLSTGFTAASSAVTALTGASGLAGLGALLTGPVGIIAGIGLAVLGIYELSKSFKDAKPDAEALKSGIEQVTAAIVELDNAGRLIGNDLALAQAVRDLNASLEGDQIPDGLASIASGLQLISDSISGGDGFDPAVMADFSAQYTAATGQMIDANGDGLVSLKEVNDAIDRLNSVDVSGIDAVSGSMDLLSEIISGQGAAAETAQDDVRTLIQSYLDGDISATDLAAGIEAANKAMKDQQLNAAATSDALDKLTESMKDGVLGAEEYSSFLTNMGSHSGAVAQQNREAADASARAFDELIATITAGGAPAEDFSTTLTGLGDASSAAGKAARDARTHLHDMVTQIKDGGAPAEDFSTALAGLNESAEPTAISAKNAAWEIKHLRGELTDSTPPAEDFSTSLANLNEIAASGEQPMSDLMIATEAKSQADKAAADAAAAHAAELQRLEDAARGAYEEVDNVYEAMSTGYRVIVSNTDSIASNANQLNDWALELINVRGQYGKIDDLLKAGTISQEEYNAAQLAQESIAQSSLRTQEAVYTIQAKQAPLLAELADQQADYIEGLATLPADQQLAALGFMDAAQSARALALAQFAVSDATMEAKENLILAAAEADPVLREMLLQMDVITEDKNGNISINTDQAQSGMDLLNETLIELNNTIAIISGHPELVIRINAEDYATDVLTKYVNNPWYSTGSGFGAATGHVNGGGPTAVVAVTANTTDADTGLGNVDTRLMELNDASADPDITADDKASSKITTVSTDLATLDGQRATTYIDTYVTTYTQTRGMATGGTVRYAAMGTTTGYSGAMQPTIVGEVGPELLMLPTGSQVMSAPATRSRAGGGMGGDIIVNVQGDVYGIDDLALKVSRELAPAIRDAFGQHYAGQGAWS